MTAAVLDRLKAALADRYRVDRELGQGGMATVYLAHDLKHEREVAIKVLHPDLGAVLGAERFLAEIKTTAKLQHPHILPLLDSGEADGLLYYVMPYVRGETLRAKLERDTQLALPEAVAIAFEVADALHAAHMLGVVHRDIKPENILLQDGHALVADFGIALAVQQAGGQRMTQTGLSLGTPQYMSPEQATGEKVVDARSDIYALAAVTYEMLTGAPPFTGATVQAIMARVMTSDAEPLSRVRKTVPPHVDAAVLQGLAKLPADRFATARDFAVALRAEPTSGLPRTPLAAAAPRRTRAAWLVTLGACALTAALTALAWRTTSAPSAATPTTRQRVVLWSTAVPVATSPGATFISRQMAISPDGSSIVFADSTPRGWALFRKTRTDVEPTPIAGTDGARGPFFSPDGRWLGFFLADGTLRKIGVDGGTSIRLAQGGAARFYYTAAWLIDDRVVFTSGDSGGVRIMSSAGGPSKSLRMPKEWRGQITHLEPLPDGRALLIAACESNCSLKVDLFLYDFAADSMQLLLPDVVAASYHRPTGLLLVTPRDGGLFAAPFDIAAGKLKGDLKPIIDRVAPGQFVVTEGGELLYALSAQGSATRELMWVDGQGKATPVDSTWRAWFEYPTLSPDGRRFAVSLTAGSTVLWMREADGSRSPIRAPGNVAWRPSWSPDNQRMLFIGTAATPDGPNAIYETDVAGRTAPRVLSNRSPSSGKIWEAQLCTNGTLAFRTDDPKGSSNIWAVLPGDSVIKGIATSPARDIQLAVSPDCRSLAYTSDESGQPSVYLVDFPGATSRRLVSPEGGTESRWSKDGRFLYYVSSKATLMRIPMGSDPLRTMGEPVSLFRLDGYARARNHAQYDVTPDGRFLMIKEPPTPPVPPVVYVQNWIPELLAKVKK